MERDDAKARLFEETYAAKRNDWLAWLLSRGVNHADAEEILQEMAIRAWQKLPDVHGDNLEPWLRAFLANLVKEVLRERRRWEGSLEPDHCETIPTSAADPIWDSEAEPVRWLTPSVLSLLLPRKLANFAEEALDVDFEISRIAERRRQDIHGVRRELQRLKQHLVVDLGCAFVFNLQLQPNDPSDLSERVAYIRCVLDAAPGAASGLFPLTTTMFAVDDFLNVASNYVQVSDPHDQELRHFRAKLLLLDATLNVPIMNYLHSLVLSDNAAIDRSFCIALSEIEKLVMVLGKCTEAGAFVNPERPLTGSIQKYQKALPLLYDHIQKLRRTLMRKR